MVIAIIAVLVTLLLPACSASERSRTPRQLHQQPQTDRAWRYRITTRHHSTFPPGYVSKFDGSGNDTGPGWGWGAMILLQMDQQTVQSSIRFDLPIENVLNNTPRITLIASWLCPSDVVQESWPAVTRDALGNPTSTICVVASANFVGVFGITEPGVDGDGIFYRNSQTQIRDITDGSSQTLLVGERSQKWCDASWTAGR